MANNLATVNEKVSLSAFLSNDKIKKSLSNALSSPQEVMKFTSSLISAVTTTPSLSECENMSLLSTGLVAHSLNLSLSPQLGFCYAMPFKQKEKKDKTGKVIEPACTKATFVMGYRGYIQLAIRSGYYTDIDVIEIRKGEYLGRDSMTGKQKFKFIEDDDERENLPIVGYMAYFEMKGGFRKSIFWTKEKMLKHADRYSPAFSYLGTETKVSYEDYLKGNYPSKDEWKYSSFWYKEFDQMAFKTIIRQLISKWGIMSLDMQNAFEHDEQMGNSDISDINNLTTPISDEIIDEIPMDANNKRINGMINAETGEISFPEEKSDDKESFNPVEDFFG